MNTQNFLIGVAIVITALLTMTVAIGLVTHTLDPGSAMGVLGGLLTGLMGALTLGNRVKKNGNDSG